MEYKTLVVGSYQNSNDKYYGKPNVNLVGDGLQNKLFLDMWAGVLMGEDYLPDFETASDPKYSSNFIKMTRTSSSGGNNTQEYLNVSAYKKRIRLSLEPYIAYAEYTFRKRNMTNCRINISGIGLGVWAIDKAVQTKLFIDTVIEIINGMKLIGIKEIGFPWFSETYNSLTSIKDRSGNDIVIQQGRFEYNETDSILNEEWRSKPTASSYAWDGNSFPGNEYYVGDLSSSMDPAAACSSLIADIQNTIVNPFI
jgi:hypothetical protein